MGFFNVFESYEVDARRKRRNGIGVINPISGNNKLGNNIAGCVFDCKGGCLEA